MNWKDLFPEGTAEDILEDTDAKWDLDWPLPIPKFSPTCVCKYRDWHARLWMFWDRTGGEVFDHRVKYRCDTSLKCARCGQVIIFGVALPEEWVEFWGPRLEVQIDYRAAKRIFQGVEERMADGRLDPTGWRLGGGPVD